MTVGPNSEFADATSSKLAPVTPASDSSNAGMCDAIDVPVTTAMRLPSRRGRRSSPLARRWRSIVSAPTPFSICEKSP